MSLAQRSRELIVRRQLPLNAEPPLRLVASAMLTPRGSFFIRSHGTIPELDADRHRLRIGGHVRKPLDLTLPEVKGLFPSYTVAATLQCAGNRRDELAAVDAVDGLKWQQGAIGNAEWTGVRLADLLRAAECQESGRHVAFASVDEVDLEGARFPFGGSIPITKALAPEVLIAYEMNGMPLAPEHGFPLRTVVPGYIGARSVKWLGEISVQEEPSTNYFQQKDYKLLPADMDLESLDWSAGFSLGEIHVNSAICVPLDGAEVPAGEVAFRGYAISGGGRTIERVELSANGGRTWSRAELVRQGPWAWTLWRAQLALPAGRQEIIARAWDSAAQTQPEQLEAVWNCKGYANNAWHRIEVTAR